SLLGGLAGVAVGFGLIVLLLQAMPMLNGFGVSVVPGADAAAGAPLVSAAVGGVVGRLPARRAARPQPGPALRHRRGAPTRGAPAVVLPPWPATRAPAWPGRATRAMAVGLSSLRGRPWRAAMTVLSVAVGIAVVLAADGAGRVQQRALEAQLAQLGTNVVAVRP